MAKKKQVRRFDPHEIGLIIAAFIVAAFMLAIPKVMGATYYWVYDYSGFGTEYDSLIYRVVINGETRDSTLYTTTFTDTVTLDQDSVYTGQVKVHDGVAWSDWGTVTIPRWSGGTATVDYDSIATTVTLGSGPNSVAVHVQDTTLDAPVQGATVTFRDVTLANQVRQARTDASGNVTFNTTYDSLAVIVTHDPYEYYPSWDTVLTNAPVSHEIYGYSLTILPPADTFECNVWGYIYDMIDTGGTGGAKMATITFTLPKNVMNTCDSVILMQGPQSTTTDETGLFQINLLRSSCVGGQKYNVVVTFRNRWNQPTATRQTTLSVPDSSTYKFAF